MLDSPVSQMAGRIMASPDLRSRIESQVCDRCEDNCWTVEVWAYDLVGTDAKACLLYRAHLKKLTEAISLLGRWWLRRNQAVRDAESRVWQQEHQGSLFE